NSAGSTTFGDAPLAVLTNDNLWHGPVSLSQSTTLQILPSTRLTINGALDDVGNPSPTGSDLTISGGGELALDAINSYKGTTFVNQGTLQVGNAQALGSTGVADVQTVALGPGVNPTGTFTLGFKGQNTNAAQPFDAADPNLAQKVAAALNQLS